MGRIRLTRRGDILTELGALLDPQGPSCASTIQRLKHGEYQGGRENSKVEGPRGAYIELWIVCCRKLQSGPLHMQLIGIPIYGIQHQHQFPDVC